MTRDAVLVTPLGETGNTSIRLFPESATYNSDPEEKTSRGPLKELADASERP